MCTHLHNTFVEPHDVSSSLKTDLVMTKTAMMLSLPCKQHVHNCQYPTLPSSPMAGTAVLQPDLVSFTSSSTCARQKAIVESTVISQATQSQDCSNVLIMRSRSATVCLAAFSSCCRACHCMRFIRPIVCTSTEGGTQTSSPIL